MFTMRAFKYVMLFWFAIFMSTIMSLIMSYMNTGAIHFPEILLSILIGAAVAYVSGIVVPITKLADGFAALFKTKKGTFFNSALSNFIYALYYTTLFAVLFTAMAIGFPPYFLSAAFSGFLPSFLIGYVVALAITPVALKLTFMICSKKSEPPAKH